MKTAKQLLRKSKAANEDPYFGLLNIRNTPQQDMGPSPAQILLGRRTNTVVPTMNLRLKVNHEAKDSKNNAKANAAEHVKSRDLPQLSVGDNVRIQPIQSGQNEWREATVEKNLSSRSYIVRTPDGRSYRRNRRQLRAKPPSTHHTPDPTTPYVPVQRTDTDQRQPAEPASVPDTPPTPIPLTLTPPSAPARRSTRQRKTVDRLIKEI